MARKNLQLGHDAYTALDGTVDPLSSTAPMREAANMLSVFPGLIVDKLLDFVQSMFPWGEAGI